MGWNPMATAPRDGTEVLLDFGILEHYGRHVASGWHSNRAWRSYEIVTGHPIAWMPLPAPPTHTPAMGQEDSG